MLIIAAAELQIRLNKESGDCSLAHFINCENFRYEVFRKG